MLNFVTPAEVQDYTENPGVASRSTTKLEFDIRRATKKVLQLVNRVETDPIFETSVPQDLKDAVLLYAEYFAHIETQKKSDGLKSESFDDYSYTKADSPIREPDVGSLIADWVSDGTVAATATKVNLRMTML